MQVGSRPSAREVASRGNGELDLIAAGQEANGEFRCAECGYGVIVRSILPSCPMCRGAVWEEPAGGSFAS